MSQTADDDVLPAATPEQAARMHALLKQLYDTARSDPEMHRDIPTEPGDGPLTEIKVRTRHGGEIRLLLSILPDRIREFWGPDIFIMDVFLDRVVFVSRLGEDGELTGGDEVDYLAGAIMLLEDCTVIPLHPPLEPLPKARRWRWR